MTTRMVTGRPFLLAGFLFGMIHLTGCALPSAAPLEEDVPEFDINASMPPPEAAIGGAPALNPVTAAIVRHGPRNAKRLALTFDACSTALPSGYDERITKLLVEMKVPATIFLGGKWMEEHPIHTRYLASLPQFELANHSYLHPHMTKISDERVRAELKWTQDTMYALTGRQASLFRAPYGEVDDRVARLAAETGLTTIQFDLASGDADKKASKEKLIEYVTTVTKKGSIVVMHINRRGWHTAEALGQIIVKLRARGFELVTVSELIGRVTPPAEVSPPAPFPPMENAPEAADLGIPPHSEQ